MYEVKSIDGYPEKYKKIAESLSRYIKFVLFDNINIESQNKTNKKKILFLPVAEEIWNKTNIDLTDSTSNHSCPTLNNIKGILFFTTEELARGDAPESFLNKSRMVRSFFERTTYAKTVNHNDLLIKLRELILDIELNQKKSISEALNQLIELKDKIRDLDLIKHCYDKIKNKLEKNKLENYDTSFWKEMQKIYTYRSFHTISSHAISRNVEESLKEGKVKLFVLQSLDLYFKTLLYDLAFTVAWNPLRLKNGLKILIIDDNQEQSSKDWIRILPLLPNGTAAYITSRNTDWERFIEDDFLFKKRCKIYIQEIKENGLKEDVKEKLLIKNDKFPFTHVIVDLLIGDYNEGNKIIRNFLRLRNKLNKEGSDSKFDIIASSLSEEVEDIHRALQEGAIAFVPKKRIYTLPGIISRLEDSRISLP